MLPTRDFGFMMTRHVNSEVTNKYWNESYRCIRRLYPDTLIVIIDDNSKEELVREEQYLENCALIKSEFPGAAELLPYYYLHKYKFFHTAIIIHDSVFIQKKLDLGGIDGVKFLWHINHEFNMPEDEKKILKILENQELLKLHGKRELWHGSFGVQSIIKLNFLEILQKNYEFLTLVHHINNRHLRTVLERIFAVICSHQIGNKIPSSYGYIFDSFSIFPHYTFDQYLNNPKNLPIYIVWSGR